MKPISQMWLDKLNKGEFIPCSAIHENSCGSNAFRKWKIVVKAAAKFYILYYFILNAFKNRTELKCNPIKWLKKTLKMVLRSALFVSLHVASFWYFVCFFRN